MKRESPGSLTKLTLAIGAAMAAVMQMIKTVRVFILAFESVSFQIKDEDVKKNKGLTT